MKGVWGAVFSSKTHCRKCKQHCLMVGVLDQEDLEAGLPCTPGQGQKKKATPLTGTNCSDVVTSPLYYCAAQRAAAFSPFLLKGPTVRISTKTGCEPKPSSTPLWWQLPPKGGREKVAALMVHFFSKNQISFKIKGGWWPELSAKCALQGLPPSCVALGGICIPLSGTVG